MKQPIFLALCFLFVLAGCKKTIQKQEENLIVKAMTDGQWVVTSFISNGNDLTSNFAAYKFQYFSNRTVSAIKNGSVETTGNWEGDINTTSISANFTDAVDPLPLLNGTWHITDNSWTFVEATLTGGTDTRILRLDKQ